MAAILSWPESVKKTIPLLTYEAKLWGVCSDLSSDVYFIYNIVI